METKNVPNQNPDEPVNTVQEENSNLTNATEGEDVKPAAKKPKTVKAVKPSLTKKTKKAEGKPEKATKKTVKPDDPAVDAEPAYLEQPSEKNEDADAFPVEEKSLMTHKETIPQEGLPAEIPESKPDEPVLPDLEKAADIEVIQEDHEEEEEESEELEEEVQINYNDLGLEEMVTLLEQLVQEEDISSLRKKVALLKMAFIRKHTSRQEELLETIAGKDEEEEDGEEVKDDLEQRFDRAFQVYSEKRKAFLDQQENQKQINLDTKKLILEELKALIESEESLKKTYDDFKDLQEKWKAIGMVPKSEVNNLWQNYHFYVEKFFDKVKINKELRDLDLKKNLELKLDLCEKAEELLLESSILKSFKQLQQYHKQWKEVGPVPQDKKDELWDRFRSTTEKINQARRDHYNKMREEQETNLVSKTALCEKAEGILQRDNNSIKDWQENTREISGLLKVWKTLGPAPRKENDEVWDRFKTSMDTFFAGKKEYFQLIKDEQLNNYNLKLDLCTQAEAIKTSTDWKETTRELINLQKEWKKIGPVPRKNSDKIWQRFRSACDEFFNSKSEHFSSRKTNEADSLQAKEELIRKVESYNFGKNKSDNLEILKGFQREWTEIGHVPFKDKDKIQNAFRKAINDQLDQLKISKTEMQTINYKQRFEGIKEDPNAERIVRNERYFLQQKIKKMEEEIQLLENNMGFLARSKKADLLKAEFTKKIEDARTEVQAMKEKIKFLERETE